jgi:SAM-dependent methyltransferase
VDRVASFWPDAGRRSILKRPSFTAIDLHLMSQTEFKWTPDFWQGWRESGNPYRLYKSQRDRRLVVKSLDLRDGERILEVGCGYGWVSQALWEAARIKWTGVDQSAEMIGRLRTSHPERGWHALTADARSLPFGDGEFDKVLCTGVLMHITQSEAAVRELIRVLRPRGQLLCSINNALSPYSLPVRLWNRRKIRFVQQFRLPSSFARFLRDSGLQLDCVAGDGIVATVPLSIGKFCFPPIGAASFICKWDEWASDRFPWLAYEVWFRGVKVI